MLWAVYQTIVLCEPKSYVVRKVRFEWLLALRRCSDASEELFWRVTFQWKLTCLSRRYARLEKNVLFLLTH